MGANQNMETKSVIPSPLPPMNNTYAKFDLLLPPTRVKNVRQHWFFFNFLGLFAGPQPKKNIYAPVYPSIYLSIYLLAGHLGSQLLVNRGELLAVSAPGRVELDQDVLRALGHQLIEVLGDGDLHVLALVVGHRL